MAKAEDGDDPMAFLNLIRQRTADLLVQLDSSVDLSLPLGKVETSSSYEAECKRSVRPFTPAETSRRAPPENLSADEEVEWWKSKIAILSAPVEDPGLDGAVSAGAKDDGAAWDGGASDSKEYRSYDFKSGGK